MARMPLKKKTQSNSLKKALREYENELARLVSAEEALSGKTHTTMTVN